MMIYDHRRCCCHPFFIGMTKAKNKKHEDDRYCRHFLCLRKAKIGGGGEDNDHL